MINVSLFFRRVAAIWGAIERPRRSKGSKKQNPEIASSVVSHDWPTCESSDAVVLVYIEWVIEQVCFLSSPTSRLDEFLSRQIGYIIRGSTFTLSKNEKIWEKSKL